MFVFRSIRHLQEASATDGKGKFPGALLWLLSLPQNHVPGHCWEVEEEGCVSGLSPQEQNGGARLGGLGACKSRRRMFGEDTQMAHSAEACWVRRLGGTAAYSKLVPVISARERDFHLLKTASERGILSWKEQAALTVRAVVYGWDGSV